MESFKLGFFFAKLVGANYVSEVIRIRYLRMNEGNTSAIQVLSSTVIILKHKHILG